MFKSLVQGNISGSGDLGSWKLARTLLKQSISMAFHHPLFGVGPGNFPVVTGEWRVAHNSYTELAAEAGFPALVSVRSDAVYQLPQGEQN